VADVEDLVHELRAPEDDPAGALVLMHGRGVDEGDLFPLVDLIDPGRTLVAFTPRAPLRLPGQPGNHWYVVERVGYPHRESFAHSYEALEAWLRDLEAETGVPPERTILGGFSQGAVMAYALGLGRGRPVPAAIVGLSGFVPEVEGWEPDLAERSELPVYTAHGAADPIIPVEFGRRARALLEGEVELTYREHPGGHTIDPRAFGEVSELVSEALERAGGAG
jgi:phospholipase/carboxylesterase